MKWLWPCGGLAIVASFSSLPAYFPVTYSNELRIGKAKVVKLFDQPIVLSRNGTGSVLAFQDGCPHRAASFDRAVTTVDGGVVCKYHGFVFDSNGILTSGLGTTPGCTRITKLQSVESDGLVWVCASPKFEPPLPPLPTVKIPKSRTISGTYKMHCGIQECISNVLCSNHVGFVHSFGNREDPEPKAYSVKRIDSSSSEATFIYNAGKNSASKRLLHSTQISVHNYYVAPALAVTTVVAQSSTKIVRVYACPVSKNETLMFWSLTRDFLTCSLMDYPCRLVMLKTLDEDQSILKDLVNRDISFHTPYDKLNVLYRHDLRKLRKQQDEQIKSE
jgi:phenylpropionate dioxygenase-like ring-hydroxylating dioxygenase large terminal subunit